MTNARVVGTATATVKHPSMEGWKLLLVQPYGPDNRTPDGDPVLAVERTGGRNRGLGSDIERRERHAGTDEE